MMVARHKVMPDILFNGPYKISKLYYIFYHH